MDMDRVAVEEKRKDKLPYDHYKSILKNFDPEVIVQNTGCVYDEEKGQFTVKLMGENVIVKYPTGEVIEGRWFGNSKVSS